MQENGHERVNLAQICAGDTRSGRTATIYRTVRAIGERVPPLHQVWVRYIDWSGLPMATSADLFRSKPVFSIHTLDSEIRFTASSN